MKKRLLSLLMVLCLVLSMLPTSAFAATGNTTEFAGGTGVEGDPYLISTTAHLNNVRNYLGAHFKMTNDIVFTDADFAAGGDFYNGGAGWTPIGDNTNNFTGTFDGNNFAVKNLYINIESDSDVNAGLFGYSTGTIKNLGMVNGDISAASTNGATINTTSVGSVVGFARGTIDNCYNTGNVSGTVADIASAAFAIVGGITGQVNGTVSNCYNTGSISDGNRIGGIAGDVGTDSTVTNCYNTGNVSNSGYVGGVVGQVNGTVSNCYNTGSVSGESGYAGGIASDIYGGTVSNCYNTGTVSGEFASAGGIAGEVSGYSTVTNCYNSGYVIIEYNNDEGGIAGNVYANATVTNCYYLDTAAKGIDYGADTTIKCTAAQLQQQSTFSGFDFTSVWTMVGDAHYPYPELRAVSHGGHTYSDGYCTVCALPEGLTYTVGGDEVTVTGYTGSLTALVIPETIEGKSVTGFAADAFRGLSALTDITIPASVKTIGANAFTGCSALSVLRISDLTAWMSIDFNSEDPTAYPQSCNTLSKDLYLNGTKVTALEIPTGTTTIPYKAFSSTTITSVTVPDSVTAIDGEAFSNCEKLTGVTLGSGVKTIGNLAFYKTAALRTLVLPASVESLGKRVFWNSGINSLTFSGKAPAIGDACFQGIRAVVYYPCSDSSWTASVRTSYDAESATWKLTHPSVVTVPGTPGSCFTDGLTNGTKCSSCGVTVTEQTTIPAAHTYSDGYCTVCGFLEGLQYTVNGDKVTVTGYTGSATELTIPATIEGKSVTKIGDHAFRYCSSLTSVTIPEGVTTIGDAAFRDCSSLSSVTIPEGVTSIGKETFWDCSSLTSVTIPEGVTTIGDAAFRDCSSLSSITIPEGVTSIGNSAFYNCSSLTSVTIPEGVTTIGKSAFQNCTSLTSVTIGDSVTTIGDQTFYNCTSLTSVTFTGNLPTIGEECFRYASATAYYPCNNDTWTDTAVANLAAAHTSVTWTADHAPKTVTGTPNSCFTGGISDGVQCTICEEWLTPQTPILAGHKNENGYCTVCGLPEGLTYTVYGDKVTVTGYSGSLTELVIPATINGKTVTAIGESAFKNYTALKMVNIPNTITTIGAAAFYNCSSLTGITIPDSVTAIGNNAFNNCNSLVSATIGRGAAVDYKTFHSCPKLTGIWVDSSNPYNSSDAHGVLFNKDKTTLIKCPEGFSGAYAIPAGVTAIGDNAFYGCVALTSVSVPDGVASIGAMSFHSCYELAEITLPASVTSIGQQAFIFCDGIVTHFKGNAPAINNTAFVSTTATVTYPCDNTTWTEDKLLAYGGTLEWVPDHDPKTVSGTPSSCFTGGLSDGVQCTVCEKWLTPQTPIPAGHKLIVDGHCTVCGLPKGLTYTMVGNTVTITRYVGPLTELTIPATINGKPVTAIDDYAFDCGYNLKSISLPDSVTYIGNGAFMSCRALENVNIPSGVTTINDNTFSGCKSLKSVTLPAGVTAIGKYAFDGCTALESLTIPDGVTSIGMNAFESCTALTGITIPASVTDIGKHAFVFCSRLAEVHFLGNAPIFGLNYFSGVTATAYYPCGDATWTENKLQFTHGGSITWVVEHHYVSGVCTGCDAEEHPTVFADIPSDSWQYPFAVYAVRNGLMAGKGTDANGNIKFDPNSPITREEFVQVLYNAEGKPAISIANPFPDVADGGWYKNAVLWAKQNDIASGKGNGNFGVGENISRQDLAMMLYKYAKLNGYSLEATNGLINQFADGANVASYAKTAMDWAVTNGIMSGKGAAGADLSTFRLDPTGIATRAECAAMLKNFQTAFES